MEIALAHPARNNAKRSELEAAGPCVPADPTPHRRGPCATVTSVRGALTVVPVDEHIQRIWEVLRRSGALETGGEGLSLKVLSARAGTLQGTPNALIHHTTEEINDRAAQSDRKSSSCETLPRTRLEAETPRRRT